MPLPSCPPCSLGHVMPSQPRSAIFFMNARRSGVSHTCAMFSRLTSITSRDSFSFRNCVDLADEFTFLGGKIEVHVRLSSANPVR